MSRTGPLIAVRTTLGLDAWHVKRLYPNIYHLTFDSRYDLCMHFLRYIEFLESPRFKGTFFTILEYMDWYAKEQCQWTKDGYPVRMFSYPADWGGFNLPDYVFKQVNTSTIPDWNGYDQFMHDLADSICRRGTYSSSDSEQRGEEPFYVIGTIKDPPPCVLDHELSHGLYYLNKRYRDLADDRYDHFLHRSVRMAIKEYLLCRGYHEDVIRDETVAMLATELPEELIDDTACRDAQAPFQTLFERVIGDLGEE